MNDGEPSTQDFLDTQAYFGLPSLALVQKDWHVVRAMAAIVAADPAPFNLIFAGGTCLARAHRLVARMSEDVDFKVVSSIAPTSRNQQRRQLGELRDRVLTALGAAGFEIGRDDTRSLDGNNYNVFNLRYAEPDGVQELLRPTIQIELNFATLRGAPITLPVPSFVAEAFGKAPEVAAVVCVNVTETAAEKLVSLTRRTAMEAAGLSRAPDPNLIRHIYDLHAVRAHVDVQTMIELARQAATADAEQFANQYPAYLEDIPGETRKGLLALRDPLAKARYVGFVDAMVYGERVDYDVALNTVQDLVDEVWPL